MNKFVDALPKRKPNRLQNYDYSQNGAYFITVCTKDRHEILGTVVVGDAALGVPSEENPGVPYINPGVPSVKLSEYGEIVRTFIDNIPNTNPAVFVPKYVIMPNHIHLILMVEFGNTDGVQGVLTNGMPRVLTNGTPRAASPTKALIPKVINGLKGLSSKKSGFSLWQRSFHDHIIRNEADYSRIAEYIENNPANWETDCFFGDSRCGGHTRRHAAYHGCAGLPFWDGGHG